MSNNDDDNLDDSDKGERKRQREKQRRTDLAIAFEELQAMINTIEPLSERRNRSASISSEADSGTQFTRLDLIRKSTEALRKIHYDNIELRRMLGSKMGEGGPHPFSVSSSWAPELPSGYLPGIQPPHPPPPSFYQGFQYPPNPYYRGAGYQPNATAQPQERGYGGYTESWDATSQRPHPRYEDQISPIQGSMGYNDKH